MPVFHIDLKPVDFDAWYESFLNRTDRKELEAKHGVTAQRIARDVENPNHAVIVVEAASKDAIQQFMNEPAIKARFTDSSVFSEPPKLIGGYERTDIEPFTEGESAAFFVDQHLADYDKWYQLWSANRARPDSIAAKHGCKPIRLLRDIDDGNHTVLVFLAPNKAAMESLMAEPELQSNFANREIFDQPPALAGQYNAMIV